MATIISSNDKIQSFTVDTFDSLMKNYQDGVNDYLTSKGLESVSKFEGGAYYCAFYPIAQQIINLEILFNQILTDIYIFPTVTQQVINRNNSIEDTFTALIYKTFGVESNFKPLTEDMAGTVSLAVNFTTSFIDSQENRSKIYHLMNENLVAGLWFYGDDSGEFIDRTHYRLFPAVKVVRDVKIEYKVKKFNDYPVLNPQQIKDIFLKNFKTKYALGVEFSNEEYLSYQELPFASFINFKLINPETTEAEVNAPISFDFNERLELGNINVVELI
jgi:hypothetical protein